MATSAALVQGEISIEAFRHGSFLITPTGLELDGEPSFEQCEDMSGRISRVVNGPAVPFVVGDFVIYVEAKFGERASQIIDAEHFAEETITNYRWVAKQVPPQNRVAGLSFKIHRAVASLPPERQVSWLAKALENKWTLSQLNAALRGGKDPQVTTRWLAVLCKDESERRELKQSLEAKGYTVKEFEKKQAKKREKKEVTAKAKRPGKRRARSRG